MRLLDDLSSFYREDFVYIYKKLRAQKYEVPICTVTQDISILVLVKGISGLVISSPLYIRALVD